MDRPLRWYDYITINAYWLGLTMLSQTLTPLVFPLLVQRFAGEEAKGGFFGTLRLWTLMVALLVQALMGMLSDRSTLHWGRRRPFIFLGTIADLVFIAAIGFSAGMEGMSGYWFLFVMALLLNISSNTAHGAAQGLIPDLVPENRRGRFSGVKAVLELPVPMILVAFTVARLIEGGNMWAGLLVTMGVLTLSMLLTMLVRERPLSEAPPAIDWTPFLRLALMTGLFTVIILALGAASKGIGNVLEEVRSTTTLILAMGTVGLVAMAIAVVAGVWVSVRISLGDAARGNSSFTWWVICRLAFLAGAVNLSSFAVFFLQGRLGLVQEEAAGPASQLIMFVGILILLLAIPSGWLADRFGHKRLVAVAGIVAALGTLVAMLAPNLTLIYIGGAIIGAGTGMFYTANWALGTSLVPKAEAGRYLGISNLAGAGAGAVGAYIGGPIADYFTTQVPDRPGLGYMVIFAIYGLLFLVSVAALAGIKKGARDEG